MNDVDLLIPRIPAGTAATSAFERTACRWAASFFSLNVGEGSQRIFQSLIVARGAKFGIPLTVPWPPHDTQGVRSEISPSRKRNGNGRSNCNAKSPSTAALRRMSLLMLPPHLNFIMSASKQRARVTFSTHVSFTPHKFGALLMIASMTADDMSWPAAFAGKLYNSNGI